MCPTIGISLDKKCVSAYGAAIAMIIFDKLWVTMKKRGVSTYQLRESCGIDSKTIRRLRANENIETKTLDKLCVALSCRLEDIAEYVPGQANGEETRSD